MSVLSEEDVLRRARAPNISSVRQLNCWGCGLRDVTVLAAADKLEVLNLRYTSACSQVYLWKLLKRLSCVSLK